MFFLQQFYDQFGRRRRTRQLVGGDNSIEVLYSVSYSHSVRVCLVFGQEPESRRHWTQQHLANADPVLRRSGAQQGFEVIATDIGRWLIVEALGKSLQEPDRDVSGSYMGFS